MRFVVGVVVVVRVAVVAMDAGCWREGKKKEWRETGKAQARVHPQHRQPFGCHPGGLEALTKRKYIFELLATTWLWYLYPKAWSERIQRPDKDCYPGRRQKMKKLGFSSLFFLKACWLGPRYRRLPVIIWIKRWYQYHNMQMFMQAFRVEKDFHKSTRKLGTWTRERLFPGFNPSLW